MKTQTKQGIKTESVDINTEAKQIFLRVNKVLVHINAFDREDIEITTYSVNKVTLHSSIDTQLTLKHYDEVKNEG